MPSLTDPLQLLSVLLPKQHILLLSHMRAYTSLFSHIIGSNPAVCGYYEMHIGYHSWRSLLRQKLLYFRDEEVKTGFSCMFDKVLHNDHAVSPSVLSRSNTRTIFSLRHPKDTLPSIITLYQQVDPTNEFNSPDYALNYYINRLTVLSDIAANMEQPFYYLDAEMLVENAGECLGSLSDWLRLETPLSTHYDKQRKTSKERYGDTSAKLAAGTIIKPEANRVRVQLDEKMMDKAMTAYLAARNALASGSAARSLSNGDTAFLSTP
ncbi:MAG: hypothetical protein GY813_08170 [Halieaceae bacterium]|nr:hypothetical protein [Halieaceae bacterium]